MAKKSRSIRELKIVLDTNALFTQTANDLVNNETMTMIKENVGHLDLKLVWHLPDTVIEERAFQMREKAKALLPSIAKVERLLGHNLAISKETLEHQVQLAIQNQVIGLGIKICPLDVNLVDWKRLIVDAQKRTPPFDAGEKEKGFRDAIILETFMQLVDSSPRTPSVCRIVLVTSDSLLFEATQQRISDYSNAQVLSSLDELKNLINTLSSQVDESYVNEVQPKAKSLFFVNSENKETLYYKAQIYDRINNEYSDQLKNLPDGAETREADGISIISPRFLKKEGQRIFWITKLRFKAKAYRMELVSSESNVEGTGLFNLTTQTSNQPPKTGINLLSDLLIKYQPKEKKLMKTGATIFEVNWAVSIDAKGKLSRPEVNEIIYKETIWE